jgi:hypothetical protein
MIGCITTRDQGQRPLVTASVSGLLGAWLTWVKPGRGAFSVCPGVTVVTLGRPPHRARGGHGPLRPELVAPLGVWPSSQLARCADGRTGWRLPGAVAVLLCCTVRRISSSGRGSPDVQAGPSSLLGLPWTALRGGELQPELQPRTVSSGPLLCWATPACGLADLRVR